MKALAPTFGCDHIQIESIQKSLLDLPSRSAVAEPEAHAVKNPNNGKPCLCFYYVMLEKMFKKIQNNKSETLICCTNNIKEFISSLACPRSTMDLAWNLKSVSGCAAMCLPVMLCHPKIAELCKLHATAPECGEYLLMVRMIPESQQVSSPVTTNKGKHGCLLVQKCLCHYVHCMLRMISTAHEDGGNLQSCRKNVFIYYMYYWSGP